MTSYEFRSIRLKLGLTQAKLAWIMGTRPVHISRTENRREPTQQQAAFIRYIAETVEKLKISAGATGGDASLE